MADYKAKTLPLNGDRKLINACKKAGLTTFHPKGEWNGYGYEQLPLVVTISSLSDMRKYNKIVKELAAATPKPTLTYEEKIAKWVARLAKLTDITIEEAQEIADEKLEYKQEQIQKLEDRQYEHYSVKRQILINKIERSNPLRYIKNSEHAYNILGAHERHTQTNYEELLEQGAEMAQYGEIDKDEVHEYARTHYTHFNHSDDL